MPQKEKCQQEFECASDRMSTLNFSRRRVIASLMLINGTLALIWPIGLGNHEVGSYIEALGASTDAEGGKFSFRRSSSIYELYVARRGMPQKIQTVNFFGYHYFYNIESLRPNFICRYFNSLI